MSFLSFIKYYIFLDDDHEVATTPQSISRSLAIGDRLFKYKVSYFSRPKTQPPDLSEYLKTRFSNMTLARAQQPEGSVPFIEIKYPILSSCKCEYTFCPCECPIHGPEEKL